jgi:DNA (cytosine-5)-methyltransferase 1
MPHESVPIIDLFAGPGGLAEGFSRLRTAGNRTPFQVRLSIEKDPIAHRTLTLRAFFRQFPDGEVPQDYYHYLRGSGPSAPRSLAELLERYPAEAAQALREARKLALGPGNEEIDRLLEAAIPDRHTTPWVLIGGPPCQAYSLVGRSRMLPRRKSNFFKDERHTLYKEYLRIIRKFEPTIFVMENVKGLLSSRLNGDLVFGQILEDLGSPGDDMKYELCALARSSETPLFPASVGEAKTPSDFVIRSEDFGIPQARHRIIIVGVRAGMASTAFREHAKELRRCSTRYSVSDAMQGLPALRSGLSSNDSPEKWLMAVRKERDRLLKKWPKNGGSLPADVVSALMDVGAPPADRGARFVPVATPRLRGKLYNLVDPRLEGVCNHDARGHKESDLGRYLFASCFAAATRRSPRLGDFPRRLLPDHANVPQALATGKFEDRFRVQLSDAPSTTVTAHISKDGHYFIHPDPSQCRSLTVREAARLQTFPDNYFFEGPRTEQYRQVGNAVPPLLAEQIAAVVAEGLGWALGKPAEVAETGTG